MTVCAGCGRKAALFGPEEPGAVCIRAVMAGLRGTSTSERLFRSWLGVYGIFRFPSRPGPILGLLAGLLFGVGQGVSLPAVAAGIATGTPTITATATVTPVPTATPTATPTPTMTPVPEVVRPTATSLPTPVETVTAGATRDVHKRRRRHVTSETTTPTPVATPHRRHHHHRHKHRHKHRKHRRPTPGPTATATPAVNLQVSNSIAPVTCTGPSQPNAAVPFLTPPYHGWTSIVSYLDHDLPDYYQDGLVITATGFTARPDAAHHASDFPAYWSPQLRQYLYYDGHNGYDYDVSYVPIYAAAPGTVIYAAPEYADALNHGYGNMVMIDHHNGYVTLYGHFSKFLVHAGERVRRGQEIGISGNTGHSSGPHLHFSVFHNCSPTDPYGWAGSGPDPLAAYQGESSAYLWIRPPLVTNPEPGSPGLNAMPGYSGYRLLLLRLPASTAATAFTRVLRAEAVRVRAALGSSVRARVDLLRGAIVLRSPVRPDRIYRIPGIVSIGSSDAAFDARSDLLAALTRAVLATRRPTVALGHEQAWHGLFLRWDGRTLLIGHGQKGDAIDLRVPRGREAMVRTIQASAATGDYAIDLGRLSNRQISRLRRQLEVSKPRIRHIRTAPVSEGMGPPPPRAAGTSPPFGIGIGVLVLIGAALAAEAWRRQSMHRSG